MSVHFAARARGPSARKAPEAGETASPVGIFGRGGPAGLLGRRLDCARTAAAPRGGASAAVAARASITDFRIIGYPELFFGTPRYFLPNSYHYETVKSNVTQTSEGRLNVSRQE